MLTIERTTVFKRDFKREMKRKYSYFLENDLRKIIEALADNQLLEPRHRDHALTGNWSDF
ncbi:type II toxin-antitoxin system mRNA interferase toxin, RelE/StbE family [Bartonella bovis]|nr:type II toxin-antitoxin system mRNA interferase toxin, RelE/StbE family [Bartonella bovis]